ncbi:hypothetical protein ccbrp13_60130 [Ktedonobacteria bacterium brp13]|nr:hypothetical protein ccbrp13_60130 [Ktedonobacteria bacterium brp13]
MVRRKGHSDRLARIDLQDRPAHHFLDQQVEDGDPDRHPAPQYKTVVGCCLAGLAFPQREGAEDQKDQTD